MRTNKKKTKSSIKGLAKGIKPLKTAFRLQANTFFLTYKGISDSGQKISKKDLANFLVKENPKELKLRPQKYLICEQMYDSGEPHFHVILTYSKRKEIVSQNFYDYLGIHPNIQKMRNMKAALEYVYKEDPNPYTNMDILQERRKALAKNSSSLYELFQEQMIKDPWNFDPITYCVKHNLTKQIFKANYPKALHLLKLAQVARCNALLTDKPGFKEITRESIEELLTPQELKIFDSWKGYQQIVDLLNQMNALRGRRPQKAVNLLITGPPNSGKSTLIWERVSQPGRVALSDFCSIYPMGMSHWFPKYQSDVYHLLYWDEARLTSYSYDVILKLLSGTPIDLPTKGGSVRKVDNPLVIMTSNLTLEQMIQAKFKNEEYRELARRNLAVRIKNVVIPEGYNLFLLQKLLVPKISG